MAQYSLTPLAGQLLHHCHSLEKVRDNEHADPAAEVARQEALGILSRLTAELQGPHEYLHELVSSNWDHGAFYAALQSRALDYIAAAGGRISANELSRRCNVPADKLVRILGLLRCRYLVEEPERGVYALTDVSEHLISHEDFRSWVEFQLFETRVASAHLADALARPDNSFTNGSSGFHEAWGAEMYEWHTSHPGKGDRFRRAMQGVSACESALSILFRALWADRLYQALDPADTLIQRCMQDGSNPGRTKVVELGGRYGLSSIALAQKHPDMTFEMRCDSQEIIDRSRDAVPADVAGSFKFTHVPSVQDPLPHDDRDTVAVYIIRNMLWNQSDEAAVNILRSLLPTLEPPSPTRILVTDGYSPVLGDFPPHIELAYRRRDITTMTMHNAKQRTQLEWLALFAEADSRLQVRTMTEAGSHVCKGLWELRLAEGVNGHAGSLDES